MPPAADDIQHPRVLMIYNTAGVDDIHAVRDDVRTPNAVSFFISIAPRGVLLFSIGIFGVFFIHRYTIMIYRYPWV